MCEYVMSKKMYENLLKDISKGKRISNPKQEVINYLNIAKWTKEIVVDIKIEG